MDKTQALKEYFGHDSFRPGQETLIDGLLSGRDSLGIMPTGGGKSLCYQIPALLLRGTALVISPLISLMKDQVMALTNAGVPAAFLNSSLSAEEQTEVLHRLSRGEYRLLYVAPERLEGGAFLSAIKRVPLSLVAVDEAHCVSQWGQDFRPSYLRIPAFLSALPHRPPVGAFTATATQAVREDIVRLLQLRDPVTAVTGFDRPNLYFEVFHPKQKDGLLHSLLDSRYGRCGIIYCATRAAVEKVCATLLEWGFSATRYHAGLSEEERQQNQDDFQYDWKSIMVATNAFGMGIDKSNVSFVIHYNMPKSLEAYYQEAGRAGRDGSRADCLLLFSPADVQTARFLLEHSVDNDRLTPEERETVMKLDRERLEAMIGYCKTNDCLRGYLLDYFGQKHEARCGDCGNCKGTYLTQDITVPAQKILSCIKRAQDHLGYSVGIGAIVGTLRGSRRQRVLDLGLDELTTYGIMKGTKREELHAMIEHLEALGYLYTHPEYKSLLLTKKAGEVLFRGERVTMAVKKRSPLELTGKKDRRSAPQDVPDSLFSALKEVRTRLAQLAGVPAYVIFSNATLMDMAARAPRTTEDLLEVNGVGQQKASRYGKDFLQAIAAYAADHDQ